MYQVVLHALLAALARALLAPSCTTHVDWLRTKVSLRASVTSAPKEPSSLVRSSRRAPPDRSPVGPVGDAVWRSVRLEGDTVRVGEVDVFYGADTARVATVGAATRRMKLSECGRLKQSEVGGAFLTFDATLTRRPASRFDVVLGGLPPAARTLSLSRVKRWWMAPAFTGEVPLETQFLLVEVAQPHKDHNLYVLALPLLSDDEDGTPAFRCSLWSSVRKRRKRQPVVVARCESGDPSVTARTAVRAALWVGGLEARDASQVYRLIERGIEATAREKRDAFRPLRRKRLAREAIVEGLGWCTWDAFYSEVDARKIELGLESLRDEAGVAVRRLIIDDGWMQLDREPKIMPAINNVRRLETHDEGNPLGEVAVVMSGETLTGASVGENAAQYLYPVSSDGVIEAVRIRAQRLLINVVCRLYSNLVERGRDDSLAVVLWRFLSRRSPLRSSLVEFYDQSTDFTRRLVWPPSPHHHKFGGAEGMSAFIRDVVKQQYGVRYVTIWHAVAGAWGGIDVGTSSERRLKGVETVYAKATPHLRFVEPPIAWDPPSLKGTSTPVSSTQIAAMYDRLYAGLDACGVDAIKADAQSGVGPLGHDHGGGPLAVAMFVSAIEAAAERHMRAPDPRRAGDQPLALTNCMCHSTENLYRYRTSAVVRASDDFYPREPNSWRFHVTACAFNSVMLGAIALPDWDMFQSKHDAAWLHAAARAISGGPVTLSDAPGAHDAAVVRALSLPDGTTLVANAPARVAADCIFADVTKDGRTPLKLVAPNAQGSAVIGVFNVQGSFWSRKNRRFESSTRVPPLEGAVTPSDAFPAFDHDCLTGDNLDQARISAVAPHRDFVAYAFNAQTLIRDFDKQPALVSLAPGEFELFALHRVRRTPRFAWAPLGLVDMLNAGASVLDQSHSDDAATVLVRGSGRFAIFSDERPTHILVDGAQVLDFEYDKEQHLVILSLPAADYPAVDRHLIELCWRGQAQPSTEDRHMSS